MTPMALPKDIEVAVKDMGARVLAVRPLEEYKSYRKRKVYVTCFDDRYQKAHAKLVEMLSRQHERSEREEVIRLPLPGAGLIMLNQVQDFCDWLLSGLLQWAFEVRLAGEVELIAHIDCGAFGGSKAFNFDLETEKEHHEQALRQARIVIMDRFPGLIVKLRVAAYRGETASSKGLVAFTDIDDASEIVVEADFSKDHVAQKVIIACPETIMRKTTHEQFGDGMHFRLNVPSGTQFFNQTDNYRLIRHLLDVPILKCGVRELISLSHPGCSCSLTGFHPFLDVTSKIAHFVHQGNAARHVIKDLYPDVPDLKVRPIFGHTFTHEGNPAIAYIES